VLAESIVSAKLQVVQPCCVFVGCWSESDVLAESIVSAKLQVVQPCCVFVGCWSESASSAAVLCVRRMLV